MKQLKRQLYNEFSDQLMEKSYQKHSHSADFQIFKQVSVLYFITAIYSMTHGGIFNQYYHVILGNTCIILLLIILIKGRSSQIAFEIHVFLLSIVISIFNMFEVKFHIQEQSSQTIMIRTMMTCYQIQILQLGSNNLLKAITILFNSSMILIIDFQSQSMDWLIFTQLLLYTICLTYNLRLRDQNRRKLFLLQHSVQIIENELIQQLDSPSIRGQRLKKEVKIKFLSSNMAAQKDLQIDQQDSFINFLRKSQIQNKNGQFLLSLENYLFNLQENLDRKYKILKIKYQQQIMKANIIIFSDDSFWIIMNQMHQQKLQESKRNLVLYKKCLSDLLNQSFQQIRTVLIKIEILSNNNESLKSLRLPLYQVYNRYLNISNLRLKLLNQNIKFCSINLNQILIRLLDVFKIIFNQQSILIHYFQQDFYITTNVQKLFQLLFTFFDILTQLNQAEVKLSIHRQLEQDLQLNFLYIEFNMNKECQIKDRKFVNLLLSQLGPFNFLQINQQNQFKIAIFEDLKSVSSSPHYRISSYQSQEYQNNNNQIGQ